MTGRYVVDFRTSMARFHVVELVLLTSTNRTLIGHVGSHCRATAGKVHVK